MKEIIITSSVLILCIMLIRVIFRGKISSRLQYALWLLVALRLIVPSSAQIHMAIGSIEEFRIIDLAEALEERFGDVTEQLEQPARFSMSLNSPFVGQVAEFMLGEDTDIPSYAADGPTSVFLAGRIGVSWLDILRGIWCGGMVIVALWMIITNIVFSRRLHRDRKEYVLPEELESICRAKPSGKTGHRHAGKSGKIKFYTTEYLTSSCLYGLPGREAIYLTPDITEDQSKLRHVVTHEMCHRRHGDSFWSILRAILLSVYWMNPLVWVAAVLSKRDCELACDEAALLILGEEERIPYGETLLSIISGKNKLSDIACTATTMKGSGKSVKERIKYIAGSPRVLGAAVAAVLILVMVISVLVFTRNPVFSGYRWEGEFTLSAGDMQIRLPESIAGISGYNTERDEKDIVIYHVASGEEVGRFSVLTYWEAKSLADQGVSITPLGNYGQNSYLKEYLWSLDAYSSEDRTTHNYTIDEQTEHSYEPASGSGGVPGTDSNADVTYIEEEDTTYILEDENWMLSDDWEVMPLEESVDYLPDEEIVTIQIPTRDLDGECYVYVKADYADVRQKYLEEMEYINSELETVTDQVIVVSVNQMLREELFATLAQNRTKYLGDATKTSTLARSLPNPGGLAYKDVTLHTLQTEPETGLSLEINYELTADTMADLDPHMEFFNMVLIFATIKNVEQCTFNIDDGYSVITRGRVEMEANFGPLWSDEADEADTYEEWLEELYVRVGEWLN